MQPQLQPALTPGSQTHDFLKHEIQIFLDAGLSAKACPHG